MNKLGSYKWIGWTLIAVAIVFYFFGGFMGLGMFGSSLPFLALIAGLVLIFMKDPSDSKSSAKTYKDNKSQGSMKMHYLFYIVGVVFIFASAWYFTREFIASLPASIKLTLLIVSVIGSFVVAEFMRGGDI